MSLAGVSPNRIVAQLDRVFTEQQMFEPMTSSRLFRVVGTEHLELYRLPRLATRLSREAPPVQIQSHRMQSDGTAALQRGDADLKLSRRPELVPSRRSEDLSIRRFVPTIHWTWTVTSTCRTPG